MIEKQVKTKYFDTNTRFVDISTVAAYQDTFDKIFVTGDTQTLVQSVTFDPAINLATCTCTDHKFNKHEVVEFESKALNFVEQYRVIDVIDANTFTFAYFELFDFAQDMTVRLPGAGWSGSGGDYTSRSGLRIVVNFSTWQTYFYMNNISQVYTGPTSNYITFTNFRFFIDYVGFYNIHGAGMNCFNLINFVYGISKYTSVNYNLAHISISGATGVWSNGATMQRILANYDSGAPTSRGGELLLQHPLLINGQQQTVVETPILFAVRGKCIDEAIVVNGAQYVLVRDAVSTFYMCLSNWDRTNV